jgi:hypothetical protein
MTKARHAQPICGQDIPGYLPEMAWNILTILNISFYIAGISCLIIRVTVITLQERPSKIMRGSKRQEICWIRCPLMHRFAWYRLENWVSFLDSFPESSDRRCARRKIPWELRSPINMVRSWVLHPCKIRKLFQLSSYFLIHQKISQPWNTLVPPNTEIVLQFYALLQPKT